MSDAEIAQARAVPIADLVGSLVPLKRDFALCIWHNEKTPSMHVDRKRNIVHCFGCGKSADPISFLRQVKRLDFAAAVRELCGPSSFCLPGKRLGGSVPTQAPSARTVPFFVLELWRTAAAPRLAEFYLESRGIGQEALPQALRGHPRVWCAESGRAGPAMIAAVTDSAGRITAIQRTWVEDRLVYDGKTTYEKGARAAGLVDPKKTWGPMGSGAVKLAAAGEVLGLSEGVENALAAAKLFRLPVWATLSAGRLDSVQLPECVTHVVIFGDNDQNQTGRQAAAKAEREYRLRGYSTQSEFPDRKDWNAQVLG